MSNNASHAQSSLSAPEQLHRKVEAALLPAIEEHVSTTSKKDDLDFLNVKNSLLLSYLIDLTVNLRQQLAGDGSVAARHENFQRLQEMKTVLDKMRGMDKKLRYQIDKLLQADNAASYAMATGEDSAEQQQDPLQYRPDPSAMMDGSDNDGSSSSCSDDAGDDGDRSDEKGDFVEDNDGGNDDDDDLAAAKQTLSSAKKNRSEKHKSRNDSDDDDNEQDQKVYRAPRLTAMPYDLESTAADKQAAKERRHLQKLRASELANTLKAQYGDAPEQEDIHGGSEYGRQAQAAKHFAARQAAITKYEEENMTRLGVSRKDKKEERRLMRQEGSNLNSIADLGHLARDASLVIGGNDGDDDGRLHRHEEESVRYANGKRKKEMLDSDGRLLQPRSGRKRIAKGKNALQAALYGGDGGGQSKKKRGKR